VAAPDSYRSRLRARAPGADWSVRVREPIYGYFMTTKRVQRRRGPRPAAPVDLLALTGGAGTVPDEPPQAAEPDNGGELGNLPALRVFLPLAHD